jgi:hypothetical protein
MAKIIFDGWNIQGLSSILFYFLITPFKTLKGIYFSPNQPSMWMGNL